MRRKQRHESWIGACLFGALFVMSLAACGLQTTDAETDNCGRFASAGWRAPPGCSCRLTDGSTEWLAPEGEIAVTCEDTRLSACPSSSGAGCGLFGLSQTTTEEGPAIVRMHFDIVGHLHDLCCASNYYSSDGASYDVSCNGCTARDPDSGEDECLDDNVITVPVFGKSFNADFPCFTEWKHASADFIGGPYAWWAPFDTSLRWTAEQVVERNMAGVPGPYYGAVGNGFEAPLFGQALAPENNDGDELRAPAGTLIGTNSLTARVDEKGDTLGLSPEQVGSFCRSGTASYNSALRRWSCI